jgi:Topoisomerase DNA binding C4 zinc finger.
MNKTIEAAEEPAVPGAADTYNSFAAFVTGEIRCKDCGGRMKLTKSKKGKFFLSCSNYPQCEKTQFVEPEMLDEYFYYKNPEGKRCPRDNKSLTAKVGQYGIYVCCCAAERHYYKLDEI